MATGVTLGAILRNMPAGPGFPSFVAQGRRAACADADPEMFYPVSELNAEAVQAAKLICQGCVLREGCLEWALANEAEGIWAATTPRERRQMRRGRDLWAEMGN